MQNLDKATRRKNGGGAVKSTADRWASNLFYGSSLASVRALSLFLFALYTTLVRVMADGSRVVPVAGTQPAR